MKLIEAIAQHFYEVNYGSNWTDVAMKDALKEVSFKQAIKKISDLNTIAVLVHHIHFYNMVVYNRCFAEKQKEFKHEDSVIAEVTSEAEWQQLQDLYFDLADKLHQEILKLEDDALFTIRPSIQNTYYKNLHGLIEHIHYHLGQISLLKKLTNAGQNSERTSE
jgi:hypothetical protein